MASVTEFVILSGPDVHEYLVHVRTQLRRHLAALFPDYRFSLATHEGEGMGFLVVPVIGQLHETEGEHKEVHHPALQEISVALEAFRPVLGQSG